MLGKPILCFPLDSVIHLLNNWGQGFPFEEGRAVKKFLSSRLIMNSRRLWNLHQRHKFLRAEASLGKCHLSGFQEVFPPRTPCCFIRIHRDWKQCHRNVPGVPRHCAVRTFHRSKPAWTCVQCYSKLANGCFTVLFDGAYFLLAVMVEGDESSQLRMAN